MRKVLIIFWALIFSCEVSVADLNYRDSKQLTTGNPELFNYSGNREGDLQNYKVVDLSASVDIGSNCGQMDVAANLRANMREFMNGDFFKGLGNQIMDAGGMLALCYLSPAMCSLTKNMRLTSSITSNMDLSACSMIEKYQDQQIAVYEKERSQCLRSELKRNGNNTKMALRACGKKNYEHSLADWAGGDGNVNVNKLIESTAKWAGLKGDDASEAVELTKAFVGDTVIGKGGVEVEFGRRKRLVSPAYLIEEEKALIAKGLNEIFKNYDENWSIKDEDILKVFENSLPLPVAKNLVQKLSYLPRGQRVLAIEKLAKTVATQSGVNKVEKSMELLMLASRNPNIPDAQKIEAKRLREQLKDSLELGVKVRNEESSNLEKVVSSITKEGEKYETWNNLDSLGSEKARFDQVSLKNEFLDCSDKAFCGEAINVLD